MSRTEQFEELRPLLFAIAYRILGSVSDAEDAVQDTWLRWEATTTEPASARSWLSTVVTRIAIDVLRSARVRREAYPGPWFPEPLVTDPYQDPERATELADSVSTAALVLLERLSPLERAVFVLREVFGYSFGEIAETVDRSEAACRQLAVRSRTHMEEGRPRFDADRRVAAELASRFFDAVRLGDVEALRELLAQDATYVADAGGKAPLWGDGVFVGDHLIRLLAAVAPRLTELGVRLEPSPVNGAPGAIMRAGDGGVIGTWAIDVLDGRIQAIRTVINPDKLGHLGPVGDAWALERELREQRRRARAEARGDTADT
jgi:RNA polymerase sigma-70 factor (ECF subfamily)